MGLGPAAETEIMSRAMRLMTVRMLNRLCTWIDLLAYRPAIVKLSIWLPQWWHCQLSHLSMKLDDRWGTGYWQSDGAPAAPNGPCDACGRRAAWLTVGGTEPTEELEPDATFLERHPVQLCAWCQLDPSMPIDNQAQLARALTDARARSISWRWRWRPFSDS